MYAHWALSLAPSHAGFMNELPQAWFPSLKDGNVTMQVLQGKWICVYKEPTAVPNTLLALR